MLVKFGGNSFAGHLACANQNGCVVPLHWSKLAPPILHTKIICKCSLLGWTTRTYRCIVSVGSGPRSSDLDRCDGHSLSWLTVRMEASKIPEPFARHTRELLSKVTVTDLQKHFESRSLDKCKDVQIDVWIDGWIARLVSTVYFLILSLRPSL